ncbi:L-asparaginase [Sulfurivirga caldicuralii]|uniref:L-asparaginase n=1 Tax=Sulfurivirga caldicuralii TaxID=364032 RepID=A0A1N6FGB5_9GAMM|nr:asparaginase domain-containing protein [Sulfurivirga caldicuralii]SIN94294.1 L-asparaginase [Sulfurivirga caldicuralii]
MIGLIITGGTLDKDYDAVSGELVFPGTCVPDMLQQGRVSHPVQLQVILQKDSLELTDMDRQRIADACAKHPARQLVITHGTDTMVETARVLAQDVRLHDKTLVLTGAMRPFRLGKSDALFNLGAALMAVQLATPGVWISMQGELFPWHGVRKDRTAGRFVAAS